MIESAEPALYPWMRPAWWFGRVRPGLRAATAADAARLRELPPALGGVVLPVLAVLLPILLSIGQATTIPWTAPQPGVTTPFILIIWDVFTESLPFMLLAGLIGLASPAAGVLLAISYAIGNLGATLWTNELRPLVPTTFGRLVSYLVLWLLVVEIPLLGRTVFEWWSRRDDAPRAKRLAALGASALTVAGLTFIWTLGAPLLVTIVYRAGFAEPPLLPADVLVQYGPLLALGMGVLTLVIFGVRYLGPLAHVGREEHEPNDAPRTPKAAYLGSLAVTMLLLSTVVRKPVDALILLAGMLAARPIARVVLRATRLAGVLAGIAWPIRLIAGFGLSLAFAWYFLAIAGVSLISPFFNMVIAIAVGLILIELFLAADDVVATAGRRGPAVRAATIGGLLVGGLPAVALADNFSSQGDMPSAAAAAAAAAGAAGAAAFPRRKPQLKEYSGPPGQESGGPGHGGGPQREPSPYGGPEGQDSGGPPKLKEFRPPGAPPPNPPPWWMPDGFGQFFGYD